MSQKKYAAFEDIGPPPRWSGRSGTRGKKLPPVSSQPAAPAEPLNWRATLDRLIPDNAFDKDWPYLAKRHPALAERIRAACKTPETQLTP
jgi:hypothetical protein